MGEALLEVVFNRLNLLETSYFGLRYIDLEGQTVSNEREIIFDWIRNCNIFFLNLELFYGKLKIIIYARLKAINENEVKKKFWKIKFCVLQHFL